jgi:hypothetical protein
MDGRLRAVRLADMTADDGPRHGWQPMVQSEAWARIAAWHRPPQAASPSMSPRGKFHPHDTSVKANHDDIRVLQDSPAEVLSRQWVYAAGRPSSTAILRRIGRSSGGRPGRARAIPANPIGGGAAARRSGAAVWCIAKCLFPIFRLCK